MKTLFEDAHLIAVERVAALPLLSLYKGVAGGVVEAVSALRGERVFYGARPGGGASGLVLLARHEEAAKALKNAASGRHLMWTYLALGEGSPPAEVEGVSVVAEARGRVLVKFETRESSVKALGRRLDDLGLKVEMGAFGLRLMAIEGPHPVDGEPFSVRCEDDGGLLEVLREGRPSPSRAVDVALGARVACALEPETDCWRLMAGEGDGEPGLTADRFGQVVLLSAREGAFKGDDTRVKAIAEALLARVPGVESVYLRHVTQRGKLGAPIGAPLAGRACEETVQCRERGLLYAIRPLHGLSPGLFLDQRHNRGRVRDISEGAKVLNTFAHTCGFSVAAAAGGAEHVVSVDASRRYLDWGRENLTLNGLDLAQHTFVAGDVIDYMRRAKRQGRRFDVVILDPPTFGRDKKSGRSFSITKDLRALLVATGEVCEPGAKVLLCTNHRGTTLRGLQGALGAAVGKGWSMIEAMRLPPDFVMDAGFAKTLWVRFH